jgi:hypothetical protein
MFSAFVDTSATHEFAQQVLVRANVVRREFQPLLDEFEQFGFRRTLDQPTQ